MGEGPITIVPQGRNFGDKSVEELERMLDNLTPDGDIPPEPVAAPVEVPPDPPVAPTPVVEAVPEPEPPPPAPEEDLAAVEREGEKIAREKLEANLALLMAHNSRLAGKLGFLEEKLKSAPIASEPFEPQTQGEVDRLTRLEQRQAEYEARRDASEVSQAVAAAVGSMDGPWVQELASEIAVVAPKYADQIKAAQETNDPALARQIATAVATVVKAEAMQMKWQARHESLVKQREAATVDMQRAKKAQTPSGSGSVPTPPPKQKSFADMTASEADAWLRENVR